MQIFYRKYAEEEGESMILNHLNLTVDDVDASREFLEKYFYMTCVGSLHSKM